MIIENKRYEIDEVFSLIGEEYLANNNDGHKTKTDMIIDGFNVRPKSLRYMTFYQKGVKCVCCGKEGTHFKLCGDEDSNRRHFNLYAEDGTLMTKDHIIPASKGGRDIVANMQTMCTDCNLKKGNHCPDVKVECIVATNMHSSEEKTFRSIQKAANYIINNCHKCGSKKVSKEKVIKISVSSVLKLLTAIENGTEYCGFTWTKELR